MPASGDVSRASRGKGERGGGEITFLGVLGEGKEREGERWEGELMRRGSESALLGWKLL